MMYVAIESASSTQARLFKSLEEVQKWLDERPLEGIEQARVYRLEADNKVRIRMKSAYISKQDA